MKNKVGSHIQIGSLIEVCVLMEVTEIKTVRAYSSDFVNYTQPDEIVQVSGKVTINTNGDYLVVSGVPASETGPFDPVGDGEARLANEGE